MAEWKTDDDDDEDWWWLVDSHGVELASVRRRYDHSWRGRLVNTDEDVCTFPTPEEARTATQAEAIRNAHDEHERWWRILQELEAMAAEEGT